MKNINNSIIVDIAERIERLITDARAHVARSINTAEVITKYEIGRIIVEVVQEGEERATYGKQLLQGVSDLLTERLGDGWSVETLKKCRQFYQIYSVKGIGSTPSTQLQLPATDSVYTVDPIQKSATLSQKSDTAYPFTLSWSHYVVLMRIESDAERNFYEIECQKQNWSVRQLQRQYNSSLYERLALSRDKDAVMRLAKEGQTISKPDDILKNPLTLEFLGLKPEAVYSESKLENAIIDKMQQFLLELGKGFLFEARQKRFTFDEENFYVDLVFYNRLLQCYVLIDLKVGKFSHQGFGTDADVRQLLRPSRKRGFREADHRHPALQREERCISGIDSAQRCQYLRTAVCAVPTRQEHLAGQVERVDRRTGLTPLYDFFSFLGELALFEWLFETDKRNGVKAPPSGCSYDDGREDDYFDDI